MKLQTANNKAELKDVLKEQAEKNRKELQDVLKEQITKDMADLKDRLKEQKDNLDTLITREDENREMLDRLGDAFNST